MIKLKSKDEIARLKIGGKILADILRELEVYYQENYQKSGFNTLAIDKKCEELLVQKKVRSSFKNYAHQDSTPFPASLCVSVNDEVVHGIPSSRVLVEGDLVSLDLGVVYDKLFTDAAISFILGKNRKAEDEYMIRVTKEALNKGIGAVIVGNTIGDIGYAIENYVKENGFGVVEDYCGHGVGYSVHEEPSIPNYGKPGTGEVLKEGMILAIEPMVVIGSPKVHVDKNGWTVKTSDSKRAAHWEHTVAVTSEGPVILTE